jgi:hypothetical protein
MKVNTQNKKKRKPKQTTKILGGPLFKTEIDFLFCFVLRQVFTIAQAGFELMILLPQLLECICHTSGRYRLFVCFGFLRNRLSTYLELGIGTRVWLCRPGWPPAHSPASTSQVWEL